MHERGLVANEPGLYFIGLQFRSIISTDYGVERDAKRIVQAIVAEMMREAAELRRE